MQKYKQYHLTFVSDEDPGNSCFCIEKAKTAEEAVKNALPKAKQHFFNDNGRDIEISVEQSVTCYDLEKDSLADNEAYDLVQYYPKTLDSKTLGKLVVWFNDRELNHIFKIFNNDRNLLTNLESYFIAGDDIRIDFEKLEQLRREISKRERNYA